MKWITIIFNTYSWKIRGSTNTIRIPTKFATLVLLAWIWSLCRIFCRASNFIHHISYTILRQPLCHEYTLINVKKTKFFSTIKIQKQRKSVEFALTEFRVYSVRDLLLLYNINESPLWKPIFINPHKSFVKTNSKNFVSMNMLENKRIHEIGSKEFKEFDAQCCINVVLIALIYMY